MGERRRAIFMVDDSASNLTMGNDMLSDMYNAYTFSSGNMMFKALEKIKPDLILLDVEMPEMNGYEVIQRLKNDKDIADIPVIFLTAHDSEESELKGFSLGAVDYITKPFTAPRLLKRIESHINFKEIQDAIRQRMKAMLDASPLVCSIFDEYSNILDVNLAAANMFGFSDKHDYINRFFELSPEFQPDGTPSREKMSVFFQQAFDTGRAHFEWMHQTLDNKPIPCEVNLERVQLGGKGVVIAYVRDLRELKDMLTRLEATNHALQYREKLLTMVNKTAGVLLAVTDKDGFESALTRNMEMITRHFGADRMRLWRANVTNDMFHIELFAGWVKDLEQNYVDNSASRNVPPNLWKKWHQLFLNGGYVNGILADLTTEEQEFINPNGTIKSIAILPIILQGQFWGFFSIDNYSNEHIFSGEELDILRSASLMVASTYDRVEQAGEMQRIAIAEKSNKAKSRFLARMSHEIRTPITAVLGISEIQLRNPMLSQQSLYVKEAFSKIHDSAHMLLNIVNDILDFTKIESEKLTIANEEYEVTSLVNDAAQLHMVYLGHKNITFKMQIDEKIPARLIGDMLRIRQIINNLVSNAFKYTESGSVSLLVGCDKTQDDYITLAISIQDTGFGMSEEQLEISKTNEFLRFHEQEERLTTGTGLGIPIVYSLVQMMNGQIDFQSEVGKGTNVLVHIPQKTCGAEILGKEAAVRLENFESSISQAMEKSQFVPEPMPYGKVLVVDDMNANLFVAQGLLAFYDLSIDTCLSGQEAIEKIEQGTVYDIVFMDYLMPGLNGTEAMHIMREKGYNHPIVILTANALLGQAEEFLESGFDDFLSKPIQTMRLNEVLNRFIRDKQPPEVIAEAKANTKRPANGGGIEGFLRSAETVEKLRLDFAQSHRKDFLNITQALETNDIKTAHRLAHTIKGSAGLIGETTLVQIAGDVENSLKDGKTLTGVQLATLEKELSGALEKIAVPQAVQFSGDKTFEKSKALALLDKLKPLLESHDADCLNLLEELRVIPETAILVRQVEEFEFVAASNNIDTLREIWEG